MSEVFSQYIASEKLKRIGNLDTIWWDWDIDLNSFSQEQVEGFFLEHGVNNETIKRFLLSVDDDYNFLLEWQFTNIDGKGEGYDDILRNILDKGPFNTPQALIVAISEYMRDHMSYDTFVALPQLQASDGAIGEFSLILNHPETKLTYYHFDILEQVFGACRWNIQELPEEYQQMMADVFSFMDTRDISGFTNYLLWLWKEDKELFLELLEWISIELRNSIIWNSETVSNILKEKKVWVCRHFSLIAKMIFNDIVKQWDRIEFTWNAEVLYVLNSPQNHVYNILIYEWDDWEVHQIYFDITTFFSHWKLFSWEESHGIYSPETEVFVENTKLSQKIQYS